MYIGAARTDEEDKKAERLASEIFAATAEKKLSEFKQEKHVLWTEPGSLGMNGTVVMVTNEGDVIGVVRLVKRQLFSDDTTIPVCGFSSICVKGNYRGQGLSKQLMQTALTEAKALGFELVVLFGRRAVDHYYPQFGIWGLSSYPTAKINTVPSSIKPASSENEFAIRPASSSDIPSLLNSHHNSYMNCYGQFERDAQYWEFLISKMAFTENKLEVITSGDNFVGYMLEADNKISEIAIADGVDKNSMLQWLVRQKQIIEISLPQNHSLFEALNQFDYQHTIRRCSYGGHMMGILDLEKTVDRLRSRIKHHCLKNKIEPQFETHDQITIFWDGKDVRMEGLNDQTPTSLTYETVAGLLSISLLGAKQAKINPLRELSFPVLDHF